MLQQRHDVLADVVIARAFPEIFGTLVDLPCAGSRAGSRGAFTRRGSG
jgi:hypothetical protein